MADLSPWHIRRTFQVPEEWGEADEFQSRNGPREPHLRTYLNILLKHRRLVVSVFLGLFGFGAYLAFSATPMYRAEAVLKIDPQRPAIVAVGEILGVQTGGSPQYDYYQTQFALLESRGLAAKVIKGQGLESNETFASSQITSASPITRVTTMFNRLMRTLVYYMEVSVEQAERGLEWVSDRVSHYVDQEGMDRPGEDASPHDNGLEPWPTPRPQFAQALKLDVPSRLIDRYLRFLSITPIKRTRLVSVVFTTPDAGLSEQLANAHAAAFIRNNLETQFELTTEARGFLEKKLAEFKEKLTQAETELNRFRKKHKVISLEGKTNIAVERMVELNKRLTAARAKRLELEALDMMLRKNDASNLSEVVQNVRSREMKTRIAGLEAEYAQLSTIFKADHPRIAGIQNRLAEAKEQLRSEIRDVVRTIRSDYAIAKENENRLAKEAARARQAALGIEELGLEYGILRGEVDANQALYNTVRQRLYETKISKDISVSNISLTERAELPRVPSSPQIDRILLLFGFLGVFCGTGLAFFVEYFTARIETPDDVWQTLGVPTFGVIPRIRALRSRRYGYHRLPRRSSFRKLAHPNVSTPGRLGKELMVAHHPFSIIAEAFREIRTALLLSRAEQPPRVILMTSANPGEGKTLASVNLAIALVQMGESVLLVDGDLRKGTCHNLLRMNNGVGLSNVLTGTLNVEQAIRPTQIDGLSLLPKGVTPPNPGDLLGSPRMRDLLRNLSEKYSFIVVDAPPANAISDALAVSRYCDSVVFVINPKKTTRSNARYVMERLAQVHAPVGGVILSGIDVRHPYYTHYRRYYTSSYSALYRARQDGTSETGEKVDEAHP